MLSHHIDTSLALSGHQPLGVEGETDQHHPRWLVCKTQYKVLIHTHTHSHSLTHTHTHTHSHTLTPTHTHTHSHPHTLTPTNIQITTPVLNTEEAVDKFFDVHRGTYRGLPVAVKVVRGVEVWGAELYQTFYQEIDVIRYHTLTRAA